MGQGLAQKCTGTAKSTGKRCKNDAIKGGTVCRQHGGGAPQVKARAAVRAEVYAWGLADIADDPGETLLKLLTQSRRRAERYAQELERMAEEDESGNVRRALIGEIWVQPEEGERYKQGEYIRGLADLEMKERKFCADLATKGIAAGLEERRIRMAERGTELLATMVQAAIKEAGLTEDQTRIVNASLGRQARELTP